MFRNIICKSEQCLAFHEVTESTDTISDDPQETCTLDFPSSRRC
jgi:hypothetical protein